MINVEQVASVYMGENGKCCCGCAGKHRYSRQHAAWSGKDRGYAVTGEDISDRSVRWVVNLLNKHAANVKLDVDPNFGTMAHLVLGKRLYVAYMRS